MLVTYPVTDRILLFVRHRAVTASSRTERDAWADAHRNPRQPRCQSSFVLFRNARLRGCAFLELSDGGVACRRSERDWSRTLPSAPRPCSPSSIDLGSPSGADVDDGVAS